MNLDSDPKNPRVRSPALHVVCADGRKNLGNSDHHLKESTILEDAFRCHTCHAVEIPIRDAAKRAPRLTARKNAAATSKN